VSRETLVDFVLNTIEEINQENEDYRFIADAFKRCGLNPWSKDHSMAAFNEHLMKLETNAILQAMITNQKALPLLD